MNPQVRFFRSLTWLRRHWLANVVVLFATVALLRGVPAWAASGPGDLRQTVPPPTETPVDTPIPPATDTPAPPPTQPPAADTPAPPPTATPSGNGNQQPPPDNNQNTQPTPTTAATLPATSGGGGSAGGGAGTTNGNRLWGDVIVNSLNMRRGPNTSFQSLGALTRGEVVEVLQRNPANSWWKVCCITNTVTSGWVSAQFITPRFAISDSLRLIPIATDIPVAPTAVTTRTVTSAPLTTTATISQSAQAAVQVVAPTPTPVNTVAPTPTKVAVASYAIRLQMSVTPTHPVQGQQITLEFVVNNPGNLTASNVELRDELPLGLTYVASKVDNGAKIARSKATNGRDVFSIVWPTLPARGTVTAFVTVQVDAALPDGAVLDNLAYAGAPNFPGTTAGVSIGMPPVSLPAFQ